MPAPSSMSIIYARISTMSTIAPVFAPALLNNGLKFFLVWKLVIACIIKFLLYLLLLFIGSVVHARLKNNGETTSAVANCVVLSCQFCVLVFFRVHHGAFHRLDDQPSLACYNDGRIEVTSLFFLIWLFIWLWQTVVCIVEIIPSHVPHQT